MTHFYKASHFESEIKKKEKELQELKALAEQAKIREFYFYIMEELRCGDEAFYNYSWTISFGEKTINIPNCADVFQGIEQVLCDYMEDEGIEHK